MNLPAAPDDLAEDGPRYEAIARMLLEGMADGRYPVGTLLPTEAELSEGLGVSRQTVRAAMRQLLEIGAISRRKGIGTRVEPRTAPAGGFQQALGSLEDLMRYAEETRRTIHRVEPVVMDRKQAAQFGCKPGTRWLHIVYIRTPIKDGAQAVGYTDVYIDERFSGILPRLADHAGLYSELIETLCGVAIEEIRQDVRALAAPDAAARALGIQPGATALQVIRRYFDRAGGLIEFTISTHPADRYTVQSTLRRIR